MTSSFVSNLLIVGAGICGLQVARRIKDLNGSSVLVLEKSRGVGGRMATRRTDQSKFDHGAQFYSLKPPMNLLHERWEKAGLVNPWFEKQGSSKFCAKNGMTSLAKNLALDLDIRFSEKVVLLKNESDLWLSHTESGLKYPAQSILLTCPLPQSLEILEKSEISFDPSLLKVSYAKALIGLFESVAFESLQMTNGYLEKPCPEIQSISDQNAKGLASIPSWTVTFSPEFSSEFFEAPETVALEEIIKVLKNIDPGFSFKSVQLKKWRYSHPLTNFESGSAQIQAGLYLAGDAFGGPSLGGAVQSAEDFLSSFASK